MNLRAFPAGTGAPGRSRAAAVLAGLAAVLAALAAAALYNAYRARRAEREHPPAGRVLDLDGVRLHYLEHGEGPPVVLIHDNVVTAEDWALNGVLDRVAARGPLPAPDRHRRKTRPTPLEEETAMAPTARSNEAEKATDNFAAISSRTADNVAAIAGRTGDNLAAISNRTADKAADATREATERTQDAASRGSQAAQRTTAGATEVGRAFAELAREQARDNVAAFRSLTDTFWDQAIQVQAELARASFERAAAFTRRYLEVVQAVTASAVSATKGQARKAG